MTTIERKQQAIDRLQKTDNESLIEGVYRLLELDTEFDEIYELSEPQKKLLEKSISVSASPPGWWFYFSASPAAYWLLK